MYRCLETMIGCGFCDIQKNQGRCKISLNLQLDDVTCWFRWFRKFTLRFRLIRKEIMSSMYDNHSYLCTEHCACLYSSQCACSSSAYFRSIFHSTYRFSSWCSSYGEPNQWHIASSGCMSTSWLSHRIFTADLTQESVKYSASLSHRRWGLR